MPVDSLPRAAMSAPGRPQALIPEPHGGEGTPVSPPGSPKGSYRSAQHEGTQLSAPGRSQALIPEPLGGEGARVSAVHARARARWAECRQLPTAPLQYLQVQEHVLRHAALPLAGSRRSVLDIGCGDGRFTFVLAEGADDVVALDIAPQLVACAQGEADARGLSHVRFAVHDAEQAFPAVPVELVSCMGVLSTMIDDRRFTDLATQLAAHTLPGGHLITKDTVSLDRAQVHLDGEVPLHWRHIDSYLRSFMLLDFELVGEFHLARWSPRHLDGLWVWRAREGSRH
jgi:2-polyprenyl-3-methyl-5-hydroxy-6-metoxy-1,4-benzoquinol methylase